MFHLAQNIVDPHLPVCCRHEGYGGSEVKSADRRSKPAHRFFAVAEYFCGAVDYRIDDTVRDGFFLV